MGRKIIAYRPTHAVVNASNLIKDNTPWHILVDGQDSGKLKKDEQIEIEVSNDAHEIKLRAGLKTDTCFIPAGAEDYSMTAFNESIAIGPKQDAFANMLCTFIVEFCHGRDIQEMIQKDCTGKVFLYVREDHLEFAWEPSGMMATLFGKNSRKIPYTQIGAVPVPAMIKTMHYTRFLAQQMSDAVYADPQGRYFSNSDISGCGLCRIAQHK